MADKSINWLKAPYGEFIISKYIKGNEAAVLIAGVPYLKQAGISNPIQLNYGIRNKDLMIFEDELAEVLGQDNFY